MPEYTNKLNLKKPLPPEDALISDINSNMDKIDDAMGTKVVTSSTRPSQPFTGQLIYETNTQQILIWTGSAWTTPTTGFADFHARTGTTGDDNNFPTGEYRGIWLGSKVDALPVSSSITWDSTSRWFRVSKAGVYIFQATVGILERGVFTDEIIRLQLTAGHRTWYANQTMSQADGRIALTLGGLVYLTANQTVQAEVHAGNARVKQDTGNSSATTSMYVARLA